MTTPIEGLLVYNQLGSVSQIEASFLGENLAKGYYDDEAEPPFPDPSFEAGKFGNAVSGGGADGAESTVYLPADILTRTSFTVSFWTKRSGADTYMAPINGAGTNDNLYFWIERRGGGSGYSWYVGFRQNAPTLVKTGKTYATIEEIDAIFPSNTWVHVMFSKNNSNGEVKVWIDGVAQEVSFLLGNAVDLTGNAGDYSFDIFIATGKNSVLTGMAGPVDELRIWEALITDTTHRFKEGFGFTKKRVLY